MAVIVAPVPDIYMLNNLEQKVKQFIHDNALLQPGTRVLVAVSGGADSVALLNILHELSRPLRLRLTVAHLNHKIRGKSADEDSRFVKQLARRLRLEFAPGVADIPRLAKRRGVSLEMAGRRARYDFFEKTALSRGCDAVATAHTANDSVESILLMLLRGCGLQGLTGISPRSRAGKMTVIRPLLGTDRRTIEEYLREHNQAWHEDISNADPAFLRNRVRHELLPLLEARYNKGIKETLNRMSMVLREENDFIERFAKKANAEACSKPLMDMKATHVLDSRFHGNDRLDTCVCHSRLDRESSIRLGRFALNCQNLAKHHIAVRRRVLRHWLRANNINPETIDYQSINRIDGLLARPGRNRAISLADGIVIRRNYQRLEIGKQKTPPQGDYCRKIMIPGRTLLPEAGLVVMAKRGPGVDRERAVFGKFPVCASLSLRKLGKRKILARPWQPGDRMNPYGLKGSKKIQDIFADAKAPVALRHRLPIFTCGREIVWIPGYRIAEGWQVPADAHDALQLTVASEFSHSRR